jgi:subtilase-type serine protease
VNGNFTQTSTGVFNAELASATSFDSLIVTGNVALGGTLAVTGLNGYVPEAGETFKIIDATGTTSTITGTFTTLTSPWANLSPMLKFEALYGTKDVKLSMTQLPFAALKNTAVASTPNQVAVGGGIDGAVKLGTIKELQKALNALPTTDKVQAALNQLSPQRYERWFEQAVYSTGANIRVVENRMDQLQREPKAGLWSEVVHRDSRFDATTEKTKARAGSDGIMVGADARVLPDLQVGAVFGYTSEKLDLDENGSTTDAKRFTGAVYGRYDLSPWFAEAVVGGSHANLDGKRTVAVPGYGGTADIETKTRDFYTSVRGGYTFQLGRAKLTPYAGGQYVSWKADAGTETGAKQASLKLQDQSRDSLASRAGITVAFPFAGEEISFTPRLDLAWRHEFRTARQTLIAEIGGSPFTLPGGTFASSGAGGVLGSNATSDKDKRDGAIASLGFDVTFGSNFTAYLRVVAESKTATDQAIEVRAGSELRF